MNCVATLFIACFIIVQPILAQDPLIDQFDGLKIRSIGPAGMSGRVTSIDALPDDPETIYIGTASGGLWKTESGGINWTPLFDNQPTQSIGAVAIDPTNPDVIWAGTGEGNPRNSHNSGMGVFKSLDGGRTWRFKGLELTRTIHRIVINPHNPDIVHIAALGSAWGPNSERGVFRTENGGESWEKVLYVNDETGCADLVADPRNPDKLIAAMWEYGRKPWFFNSGGKGSGLYISWNGGKDWTRIEGKNSGLPEGELGRMGLAFAPSEPNMIYAYIEAKENGLYRSTDGGRSWKLRGSKGIGNRPFYYADIYVDPGNENRIYSLHSMVSESEDGGKTWEVIIPYSGVHPDHHAFWINPRDSRYILDGNDGGLNISHDRGKNWRFVENLPLGQFYHINIDRAVPYNVYGGMQDNGSWVGPAYVWQSGGIRNANWQEVLFGDGFDMAARPDNNRYGYAMFQGGGLSYWDKLTGKTQSIRPNHPENDLLRFNWNAALSTDPFTDCGVYYGSQYVHFSSDCGKSWQILSPDLTTNDTSKQKQALSGGLTPDVTQAENYTTILAIAPSPHDQRTIWASTDDGHLQLTRDRGKTWTELSSAMPGMPAGSWIPQIELSATNKGEAFVVVNDYRRNNWAPYLYHTKDFGKSWRRLVDESKIKGFVLSVVQDPEEPNLLFLGSDAGLWISFDYGLQWTRWNNQFPAVQVSDLKIHPDEHDLIVGTFGRAAWILDDIRPLRKIAAEGKSLLEKPMYAFDPPPGILASYKQPPGVRFDADAGFRGWNRRRGLTTTLWLHPDTFEPIKEEEERKRGKKKSAEKLPEKPEAVKNEKIKVWVKNSSGDTIRYFTATADTGMVRVTWDMHRRGPLYPSWEDRKPDAGDPRGAAVLPGTYRMIFKWKSNVDSVDVEIKADPRTPFDEAIANAAEINYDRYFNIIESAELGFSRLKEAQKIVKKINSNIGAQKDTLQKDIRKEGKILIDSIRVLQELFITPEDFKGYDGQLRLRTFLGRARSTLSSAYETGDNAEIGLQRAEYELNLILTRLNIFFEGPWMEYREKVERINWEPFKDYKPMELKR